MDEQHETDDSAATNGHSGAAVVLAGTEARAVQPAQQPALPAPVVAAAGGALAGVAAFVLLRVFRRVPRNTVMRIRKRRRGGFEITGSRSFLVDVHMIKR